MKVYQPLGAVHEPDKCPVCKYNKEMVMQRLEPNNSEAFTATERVLPPSVVNGSADPEPIKDWATAADSLLKTADRLVNGSRDKTYGSAEVHHSRTAALWSTYLQTEVTPEQVSVLFILDKIARSMATEKVDNFTDIAGYAQVHAKVMAAKERGEI